MGVHSGGKRSTCPPESDFFSDVYSSAQSIWQPYILYIHYFQSLFQFRIEAGDDTLRDHVENAAGNAKYTSVRTHNELISICEDVLREDICEEVIVYVANAYVGFSILLQLLAIPANMHTSWNAHLDRRRSCCAWLS